MIKELIKKVIFIIIKEVANIIRKKVIKELIEEVAFIIIKKIIKIILINIL